MDEYQNPFIRQFYEDYEVIIKPRKDKKMEISKESCVDVNIYLPFMKMLIKKYGNFKVSPETHNLIIYNLCEICDKIETERKKNA